MSMQIDNVAGPLQPNHAIKRTDRASWATNKRSEERSTQEPGAMSDQAHTSALSRLASREMLHIKQNDSIRPEIVERLRQPGATDVLPLSDGVIDDIFNRMMGLRPTD